MFLRGGPASTYLLVISKCWLFSVPRQRSCLSNASFCYELYIEWKNGWIIQLHLFGTVHTFAGDGMLMWALERSVRITPPGLKLDRLTDGGGSGRVIGSRVTHAGVNDSDMSNNQGNAWSASRSSISQRERISGLSCAGAAAGLLGPAFIIHVWWLPQP